MVDHWSCDLRLARYLFRKTGFVGSVYSIVTTINVIVPRPQLISSHFGGMRLAITGVLSYPIDFPNRFDVCEAVEWEWALD